MGLVSKAPKQCLNAEIHASLDVGTSRLRAAASSVQRTTTAQLAKLRHADYGVIWTNNCNEESLSGRVAKERGHSRGVIGCALDVVLEVI